MTVKSAWRLNNIGRRMNEAVRIFERRIIELLREKGHAELIFFVLVDGWHLVAGGLIQSYGT